MEFFLGMDIYLIDQILKGRYISGERILDAGAGGGRNLNWFFAQGGFEIHACDLEAEREELIHARYPGAEFRWSTCDLLKTPYADEHFRHVICNAVLHFAESSTHFMGMAKELHRVMQPKASLFIRMNSDIGIENQVKPLGDGRFLNPDGSERFLLTQGLLEKVMKLGFDHLEAPKHVNVAGIRVMSVVVLVKTA
jgi:ubiquinone/menaquinone biosynthesis C-methylase UbiE